MPDLPARVLFYGVTGSGKTTAARRLAEATGLPLVDELVLALDYPRWVSLTRLVRRTASRVVRRMEVCNGNRETLARALDDDSIVRWHFRSFRSKRERIQAWEADPAMPPVVRFTRPRELDAWIDAVAVGSAAQ